MTYNDIRLIYYLKTLFQKNPNMNALSILKYNFSF